MPKHSSTTVRTPQQRRSIEKKQAIVQAAAQLFAEIGYAGTTSKSIAAKAGVSVGTFYSYFKDKKALIMEVARLHDRELQETLSKHLGTTPVEGNDRDITRNIVEATYRAHNLSPGFHREALALSLVDEEMREYQEQMDQAILSRTVTFLTMMRDRLRVTDLEAAARTVNTAVEGVIHSLVLFDEPDDAQRVLDELADMLGRYLFKDSHATLS